MNTDGSGVKQLTHNTADDQDPEWSPDGEFITFGSDREGDSEIYIMRSDGSSQTRITNNPARDWWPTWGE